MAWQSKGIVTFPTLNGDFNRDIIFVNGITGSDANKVYGFAPGSTTRFVFTVGAFSANAATATRDTEGSWGGTRNHSGSVDGSNYYLFRSNVTSYDFRTLHLNNGNTNYGGPVSGLSPVPSSTGGYVGSNKAYILDSQTSPTKLLAYTVSSSSPYLTAVTADDITLTTGAGTTALTNPVILSDGTYIWLAGINASNNNQIQAFAYQMSNGARASARDISYTDTSTLARVTMTSGGDVYAFRRGDRATRVTNTARVLNFVIPAVAPSGTVPNQTTTAGTAFSLDLSDHITGTPAPTFTDPQNSLASTGLTLTGTTISGTTARGNANVTPHQISLTATNSAGTLPVNFTISIRASAQWQSIANRSTIVNAPFSLDLSDFVTGVPVPTITLASGVTLPMWLNFSGTTLSGTPTSTAAAQVLRFTASNGIGAAVDTSFTIAVVAAQAPVTPTTPTRTLPPPEVTIGPFENLDGSKAVLPLPNRDFFMWVSWSEDPGDAFGTDDVLFRNDPRGTSRVIAWRSIELVKRVDNRFLFRCRLPGQEGFRRFQVRGNVFRGNATTNLDVWVNMYNPQMRFRDGSTVPAQKVVTRNTSVTFVSGRGRPSYWKREGFSLEGIVNGAFFSSRDAITSLTLPRNDPNLGDFAGGAERTFTANIELPDKSSGTVRVRVDKFSALTHTGGGPGGADALQLEFAGRGPANDYLTEPFNFDTRDTTTIALDRGARGSNAIDHAENSEMLLINEILDIQDARWMVKPIDELQWRTDERSLYNKIRVIYGDGQEFLTENPRSIYDNGEREFSMRTPLAQHQTHWVRWIGQNLLDSFSELQYTATLQLKLSLQFKLGQTILLRGLPQDDINNIVQVIGIEHNIAGQSTLLTVRTVRRATPQSSTAPIFATNIFTNGQTITLQSGTTYSEQLVAFGNPTPSISVTGNPSWMRIDSEGNINATIPNVVSSSTVVFTASNGVTPNATFTLTFNVVIANRWQSGIWNTFRWAT